MAFRLLQHRDVPEVAALIRATGQGHAFQFSESFLAEKVDEGGEYQCFVWDQEGIQGAYLMNWKPEMVLVLGSEHFCFLDRMFWRTEHPTDLAARFFLHSAQFEATLRGFDDLILPLKFAVGGFQTYLDLGGEQVHFQNRDGTPMHSTGIRFHLL